MGRERTGLDLSEENEELDITLVVGQAHRAVDKPVNTRIVTEEAIKAGFVSREPKMRRKKSPYTEQFGGRCRKGMKELFQDAGDVLGLYDTQTLELAVLALLEKEELTDLIMRYNVITGNGNVRNR